MSGRFTEDFEQALRAHDPLVALRGVAARLVGIHPREVVFKELDAYRLALRDQDREDDEDLVAEAMGYLDGYCAPHMLIEDQDRAV